MNPASSPFNQIFFLILNYIFSIKIYSEVLEEQTECYIRALQWTLSYYYHGCQSWSWYYPHHYAPYISDIQNFKNLKLKYDLGEPFLPFQQLMGVLPAGSRQHVPRPYQTLMLDNNSPIIDYYPPNFETDLNGKKQEWEAVVLIPFIDEKRLLSAMETCNNELNPEECSRNIHGPMLQYDYCTTSLGCIKGIFGLPDLGNSYCTEKQITRDEIYVPEDKLVLGPSKGSLHDIYFPGFPTMKHLNYSSTLQNGRVRVFDQPGRNDNMVIKIIPKEAEIPTIELAKNLIGMEIFINWPHLTEAKVIRVSDRNNSYSTEGIEAGDFTVKFDSYAKGIKEHHTTRLGISFGDINQLVHVKPITGREYVFGAEGRMTLTKTWGTFEIAYPVHGCVKDIKVHAPKFIQYTSVEDVFPVNTVVFMLSTPYYGSQGEVIDPSLVKKCGRIKVNLIAKQEPDFTKAHVIHDDSSRKYLIGYNAAREIGISGQLLGRITGSILVIPGMRRGISAENQSRINLGLQLKFKKSVSCF